MSYYFLSEKLFFPPVNQADEHGIVAIGGDLSLNRLLLAYQSGIFPWFSEEEPIIWWCPDPRFVLYPPKLRVSKSMKQILKSKTFEVTFDQDFLKVIQQCQKIKRKDQTGTWITGEMMNAYHQLHRAGYAHSVEVWQNQKLVGGLYGVSLGRCFYGESMFSTVSNASKTGFITLVQHLQEKQFHLIDCQVHTTHLESLGAEHISRELFLGQLKEALQHPTLQGNWREMSA